MPSQLRYSSSPSTVRPASSLETSTIQPPQKKQKMSLTQTYFLAHTARSKLSKEAAQADHNLRLLVGHANLLDSLMLDLAEAEREQESWFHHTVRGAAKASEEPKHIQWADGLPGVMEDDDDEESWDGSDADDEEEISAFPVPIRRAPSPPPTVITTELDMGSDEEDADYDDEEEEELALTRTSSHSSARTPPELLDESDTDSEDDSMPPSPPQVEIALDPFSEKHGQSVVTTSFYDKPSRPRSASATSSDEEEDSLYQQGFYIPQRQQVAAY